MSEFKRPVLAMVHHAQPRRLKPKQTESRNQVPVHPNRDTVADSAAYAAKYYNRQRVQGDRNIPVAQTLSETSSEVSGEESRSGHQFGDDQGDSGFQSGVESPISEQEGTISSSRKKFVSSSVDNGALPDINVRPGHVVKHLRHFQNSVDNDNVPLIDWKKKIDNSNAVSRSVKTEKDKENTSGLYTSNKKGETSRIEVSPDRKGNKTTAAGDTRRSQTVAQSRPAEKITAVLRENRPNLETSHPAGPAKSKIRDASRDRRSKPGGKPESLSQKDKGVCKDETTVQRRQDGGDEPWSCDAAREDLKNGEKTHCPHCLKRIELCSFIENDVIGSDNVCPVRFGMTKLTYLDYIASGRPLKCFETYIRYHVMPTYANTHTEVNFNAQQTTKFREEARAIIRECVNASEDDAVIFTGSGATAAVNKLIYALNIKPTMKIGPTVLVGPYEHHSNILPWRELKATVITIRQTSDGLIDMDMLESELQKCRCGPERLIIGSFSAASNVTGILTDVDSLAILMHKYKGIAIFDYACAAPYVEIDMNPTGKGPLAYKDAIFLSPHKFIGGPQTPGVLIAKRWMFRNEVPHGVGGGTVSFVRRTAHKYLAEVEHREEGGTPAITESIRAGLVFKLKASFTPKFILRREEEMYRLAVKAWSDIPGLLLLGNLRVKRLPIFSMLFMNKETGRLIHHDFIATILNDVFGIQVRSGCACAGPYGMDLMGMTEKTAARLEKMITGSLAETHGTDPKKGPSVFRASKSEGTVGEDSVQSSQVKDVIDRPCHTNVSNVIFKPGFVRLSFPYFMSESCFHFVIKAIMLTALEGWTLLPLYDFDRTTGRWWFRKDVEFHHKKSLHDVTFREGRFKLRKPPKTPVPESDFTATKTETSSPTSAFSTLHSSFAGFDYDEILERAQHIFEEARESNQFNIPDQTKDYTDDAEQLRWFMLPSEASNILNNKPVKYVDSTQLPFLPQPLEQRLLDQQSSKSKSSEDSSSRDHSTEDFTLSRYSCSCCCCCCSSIEDLDQEELT